MSIEFFSIPKRTTSEWDSLPPLVHKGQDCQEVISRVLEQWCQVSPAGADASPEEHWQRQGLVLDNLDLVDANTEPPSPIDLGELLRQTERRLLPENQPYESRRDIQIILRGCRIRKCNASSVKVVPRFTVIGCRFDNYANFESATLGRHTDFSQTEFGTSANFSNARFGMFASFFSCRFGYHAQFNYTMFGTLASFRSASFNHIATFRGAKFEFSVIFDDCNFKSLDALHGVTIASEHKGVGEGDPWNENQLDILKRVEDWLKMNATWELVRVAGESAILNRVSIFALVVVPLIAGIWPAVHALVRGYALGISGGMTAYEAARAGLLLQASKIPGAESVPDIIARLDSSIEAATHDLQQSTSQEVPLPISWAVLFFGALAVTLGKTFYGWGAPDRIHKGTREQAMAVEAEEYREKRKDQQRDLLIRAMSRLNAAALMLRKSRHQNFVARNGGSVWVPDSIEALDTYSETYKKDDEKGEPYDDDGMSERAANRLPPEAMEIILVEEGASAEYDIQARRAPFRMNLTLFFYVIGVYCIAWLITQQATSILKQSGAMHRFLPDYWTQGLWTLVCVWWFAFLLVAIRGITKQKRGK